MNEIDLYRRVIQSRERRNISAMEMNVQKKSNVEIMGTFRSIAKWILLANRIALSDWYCARRLLSNFEGKNFLLFTLSHSISTCSFCFIKQYDVENELMKYRQKTNIT